MEENLVKRVSSKFLVSYKGDDLESRVPESNFEHNQEQNKSEKNGVCHSISYKSQSNCNKSIFTKTCTAVDKDIKSLHKKNESKDLEACNNNSDSTIMDSEIANDETQESDKTKKDLFYTNLENELILRAQEDQELDSEIVDEEAQINNALKEEM